MVYIISKEFNFSSSHRLFYNEKNEEENKKIFGKCYNLHGHNFKLIVYLKADTLKDGMVMNFSKVKEVVKKEIIDKYDHQYINNIFKKDGIRKLPTAENLCYIFYTILFKKFTYRLYKVGIYETATSYAEYGSV